MKKFCQRRGSSHCRLILLNRWSNGRGAERVGRGIRTMTTDWSQRTRHVRVACVILGSAFLLAGFGASAGDSGSVTAIDLPVAGPCFAPGTPPDVVERTYRRQAWAFDRTSLSPPEYTKYVTANRWTSTATDGGGLSQGDPITLTWSVVPDGTTIPGHPSIGDDTSPSNLRAFLNGIYGSEAAWLAVFQQVFDRWGELTGITYVYEPNDDGGSWTGAAGQIGVRGDVRISGHAIDGGYGILAYNFYPNTGDMVIDTADSYFDTTSGNSIRLRNTMAHEHGHGIGLDHVCPANGTKLMEPFISTSYDGPQHDDVLAANRHYGDRFEHDDSPGTAGSLGSLSSATETNLSIDDYSDIDILSLSVVNGSTLDVTVTPVGATYLSGEQNSDGSCSAGSSFNSLIVHDLGVRVLDTDGTSELAAADENGAGQAETLTNLDLPSGAGTYYVEITGDSTNSAQLYELSLSVSASIGIFTDGFESDDTTAWSETVP